MDSDLEYVITLARTAGVELLRLFRAAPRELGVERKGPRDLVTVADRRAEEVILAGLSRRFPNDELVAEESGRRRGGGTRCWHVDPLDGTTNFAAGHPLYSISIALWEAHQPRLAVVHAPTLGETYWAESGAGAWRDGCRLAASPSATLGDVLLATGFSYARAEIARGALALFAELLGRAREIRRGGCASLDLAFTAAGIFGGFWEYYLQPHDVAAGALLVMEAGGRVTDVAAGNDYLRGGSIIAAGAALHPMLLEAAATLGPPHPGAAP